MTYEIKDRLRDYRLAFGWTQEQAAKLTGLSAAAISHFETGKREPSASNLRKLAIGYKVSADYILGTREGNPKLMAALNYENVKIPPHIEASTRGFSTFTGNAEKTGKS